MPGTIVTLVLYVIAVSSVVTTIYHRFQARERQAYAYSSLAFLNALLRALRCEAATIERKGDLEFAALVVRFEAAHAEARAALTEHHYDAVSAIVDGAGRELAEFRQAQAQKRVGEKK
jgi:hypothetical protein